MKSFAGFVCVALLAGCGAKAPEASFVQNERGVVVTPTAKESQRVRLEVRSDHIVRVSSVDDGNLDLPKSIMVVESSAPPPAFKVEKRDGDVVLTTAHV